MGFRDKINRFMIGRNGVDELFQFESWVLLFVWVIAIFSRLGIVWLIGIGIMCHMYFRVFSKNVSKRYAENQKFRNWRYNLAISRNKRKVHWEQRKMYKFFKCPMCQQKVRVPKGHGKICIKCPKCREEFVRRS